MRDRTPEGLRYGWTTGTCAAGAAASAYSALLGRGFLDPIEVRLPRGGTAVLQLAEHRLEGGAARAGIIKDAGDDPDVTHGCLVQATVRYNPGAPGVRFEAGEGIGRVTRAGLPLPPGEPAINPMPRQMIERAMAAVAAAAGEEVAAIVTLSIPGGEALAAQTLNARLGIVGGLSILGTTGIVVPFSCSAWIHTIHRGIDVARAAGIAHVAAATGSTSERVARALHELPDMALLEMGDFAGATLKYLRRHPVPRLTLAGGFAKLVKLGQGHLDLHSQRSRFDLGRLLREFEAAGGSPDAIASSDGEASAGAVLQVARAAGVPLADRIAKGAREIARSVTGEAVAVEVVVVDRSGEIVGRAPGW
jgi:cobalt-precorrin-5B (C1)-methyltransferase